MKAFLSPYAWARPCLGAALLSALSDPLSSAASAMPLPSPPLLEQASAQRSPALRPAITTPAPTTVLLASRSLGNDFLRENTPENAPENAPEPPTTNTPLPEPLVEPDSSIPTTNYADEFMSIDYPSTWQIEVSEEGVSLANIPETANDRVDTKVFRIQASPGAVVNANIDSFIEEGSAVGPYRAVTIDNQDALVIWLAERPNTDSLSKAIATFIGYGSETVLIFSRYSETNTAAEDSILRLHSSFTRRAATPPPNPAVDSVTEAVPATRAPEAMPALPEPSGSMPPAPTAQPEH